MTVGAKVNSLRVGAMLTWADWFKNGAIFPNITPPRYHSNPLNSAEILVGGVGQPSVLSLTRRDTVTEPSWEH